MSGPVQEAGKRGAALGRPVAVYAGRYRDRVEGAGLPEGCEVMGEWDVLPHRLSGVLRRAGALVLLDLLSFPYEAMPRGRWDVPVAAVLPQEHDEEFLVSVLEKPLFERLGFFDLVVTADDALWEALGVRYGWAACQRIRPESEDPAGVAREVCGMLLSEEGAELPSGRGSYEAREYWRSRGERFAREVPHRAICSAAHGRAFNKAIHGVQAAALEPQLAAVRSARAEDLPLEVLEVGCGVGRWAASLGRLGARYTGLDVSEAMVGAAGENFPWARFEVLEDDLEFPFEDESFDLAFTVTVLHHNPTEIKRRLLSEMWRVVRPGGRLAFLEDFVGVRRSDDETVYPMSVSAFVELLVGVSGGEATLEHFESVKYPHDDFHRGGLMVVSRLGVPRRW